MSLTAHLLFGKPTRLPKGRLRTHNPDHRHPGAHAARNTETRLANVEKVFNAIADGHRSISAIEDATELSRSTVEKHCTTSRTGRPAGGSCAFVTEISRTSSKSPLPDYGAIMQNLFIPVPETILPNGLTVPAFQVGQYVCSKSDDGQVAVTAEGTPWVNINYHDARKSCEAAGFKLITESQWLAIAWNASQQDGNWTKGKVGEGKLFRGLCKNSVSCAQAGTFEPSNKKERRWLTLSNSERICDLNGNVWQWIVDDIQGDESGLVAKAFAKDSPSLTTAPFPSLKKGMGWRPDPGADWSGYALIRGGSWDSERVAGAFGLYGDWSGGGWVNLGFRCTL